MKTWTQHLLAGVALASCFGMGTVASAQSPALIPVQGVLYDDAGEPITVSTRIQFAIYDSMVAADPVWTETQVVPVENGLFTAYLGTLEDLDLGAFALTDSMYLGITVGDDSEMERIQLASVPYAAYAEFSEDASTLGGQTSAEIVDAAVGAGASVFAGVGHEHSWADITSGVPAGLDDGDDVLTEAEVDAYADNNGYLTAGSGVAWSQLTGVPAGLADGDDVLTEAQVDAYANNNGYLTSSSSLAWGRLTGVPAGFADGIDNDLLATLEGSCSEGQVVVISGGAWRCEALETPVQQYQRNNGAITEQPAGLERYHLTTDGDIVGGDTVRIPDAVLESLCGDPDGCHVRLGMTRWTDGSQRAAAAREFIFYWDQGTRRWRANNDNEETDGSGGSAHIFQVYETCYFTEIEYVDYVDRRDSARGINLLTWRNYSNPDRTCELTIID